MHDDLLLVDSPNATDAPTASLDCDDAVERLRRAAVCYGEMASTAACWAHPSWLATPLGLDQAAVVRLQNRLTTGPREDARSVSAALLSHCHIGRAPFAALVTRKAHAAAASAALLCMVPATTRLQMLCMRALLGHTEELRRTIARPARDRLSRAIGLPLSEFVARSGHERRRSSARDVGTFDAGTLAVAGYAALVSDRAAPGRFAALALSCDEVLATPAPTSADAIVGASAGLASVWAALLPDLYPEWSWLFG